MKTVAHEMLRDGKGKLSKAQIMAMQTQGDKAPHLFITLLLSASLTVGVGAIISVIG